MFFMYFVLLPPVRASRWDCARRQPTQELKEFPISYGEAGFEPGTATLQSGVLTLTLLSPSKERSVYIVKLVARSF